MPEREFAGPRFAVDLDAGAAPSSADPMLRPMDLGGALWGADPHRPLGALGLYGAGGGGGGSFAPPLAAGAGVLDGWAAGLSPAPGGLLGGSNNGGGIGALWPGAGGPIQHQSLSRSSGMQGSVGGVGGGSALDGWRGLLHASGGGAAASGAATASAAIAASAPSDFAVALVNSAAAAKAAEMGLAPVVAPPPAASLVCVLHQAGQCRLGDACAYAHMPSLATGGGSGRATTTRESAESSGGAGGAFGLGNFSLWPGGGGDGRPFSRASYGQDGRAISGAVASSALLGLPDELLSPPPQKARPAISGDGGGGGGGGASGVGEWLAAQLGSLARAPLGSVQPPPPPPSSASPRD